MWTLDDLFTSSRYRVLKCVYRMNIIWEIARDKCTVIWYCIMGAYQLSLPVSWEWVVQMKRAASGTTCYIKYISKVRLISNILQATSALILGCWSHEPASPGLSRDRCITVDHRVNKAHNPILRGGAHWYWSTPTPPPSKRNHVASPPYRLISARLARCNCKGTATDLSHGSNLSCCPCRSSLNFPQIWQGCEDQSRAW